MKKILLLGSGELGKEFTIAAKRAGQYVIACDKYDNAPAMQVADEREVFSMLDGDALTAVVEKHHPDLIVPEIEAIRTERLFDFEKEGICQVFLCQDFRRVQACRRRDWLPLRSQAVDVLVRSWTELCPQRR